MARMSKEPKVAKRVKSDEFKTYELAYLLSPIVAPDQLEATVEKEVKAWLGKAGAEIKHEFPAQARSLAYPIKKVVEHKGSTFRNAYFGAIYFNSSAEAVVEVEANLKKSTLLIRYMILTLKPSALEALVTEPAKPETKPIGTLPVVDLSTEKSEKRMTKEAIDQEIDQLLTPVA